MARLSIELTLVGAVVVEPAWAEHRRFDSARRALDGLSWSSRFIGNVIDGIADSLERNLN